MRLSLPATLCGICLAASVFAQAPVVSPADDLVQIQYPNTDVKDVLAVYERLTGKKLIIDNLVQGPVNIVVSSKVPREDAIRIIETNLFMNGFSLIPTDHNIVKVLGLGKSPRVAGVPVISEPDQIPENDRVITYVFKLRFADPTELQQSLGGYIQSAPSIYTNFVALPKAQALLVTESTPVIRSLLKIIQEIDIQPAEVVSEFIKLERADAKDVLEKLEKIFQTSPTGPGGATRANFVPRAPVAGQTGTVAPAAPAPEGATTVEINAGGLSEESIVSGKIKLTADIRTNRIHVVTRPINMPFIRKLLREFDSDIQFGEPSTRALKYVSAGDVLPVVVKAITEPGVKPEDAAAGQPGGTGAQTRPGTTGTGRSNTGGSSSTGSEFSVSEELSTQPAETTPQAVTVGNTKIIADRRANTIIVLGNQEVKQKIARVIDEIDVRAPQVMLNTVIGELTLSEGEEFGVDFLQKYQTNAAGTPLTRGGAGFTNNTGLPIVDAASLLTPQNFAAIAGTATGLNTYIAATDSLQAIVHALETTQRFRVTQRPMVFTSNNKKAIIASGREIAVPTQTLSTLNNNGTPNNNASVSSSVQFKRVALQLEVVPLINSDREVSLDILQKVDSLSGDSTNVGGNVIPTISTRYIKTNVSVANGSTIVLGGLITKNNSTSTTGIPVLSRLPVLGYLFKNTKINHDRTELIVLMRPIVTLNPGETSNNSEHEQERLLIQPNLEATLDPPGSRIRAKKIQTKEKLLIVPKPPLRLEK